MSVDRTVAVSEYCGVLGLCCIQRSPAGRCSDILFKYKLLKLRMASNTVSSVFRQGDLLVFVMTVRCH